MSEGFSALGASVAVGLAVAVAVAVAVGEGEGVEATVGDAVGDAAAVGLVVAVAAGLSFGAGVLGVQETAATEKLAAIARLHKKYFFMKFSLDD
ncbi:hypothetical protein [Pseudanabaena sp. BC1403]|uniref:hypothetical protein n=1 Tax=Pseudanabaena sp. BC1403 TaxID=2043171 RepID=UPI0015E18276|nr:hypothetical protein [Pseudanabaena sp. BC1403]